MVNMCVSIETSRAIAQQILRHRSFCLGADSVIWFDLPGRANKYQAFKKSIGYLYDRFHNGAEKLPNGKRIPMADRIKSMNVRCLDEDTGEIVHTHINDVTKSTAHLHKITFTNGNSVTASMDHRFYTETGWLRLEDAINSEVEFICQGQLCNESILQEFPVIDEGSEEWLPVPDWDNYSVSNMGRLKRIGKYSTGRIRTGSISKSTGYPVVSFDKPGTSVQDNIHRIVLKTFRPLDDYGSVEARHLNHNKLDCRLSNLEWGSALDNRLDSISSDLHGRLRSNKTSIKSIEDLGTQDSYDISVDGPWHNFICDGQVVHNSFQEFSQRYAAVSGDMIEPVEVRLKAEKDRQSSSETTTKHDHLVQQAVENCFNTYEDLLANGVATETARMVLPLTTKTKIYMNGTIRSWIHYLE